MPEEAARNFAYTRAQIRYTQIRQPPIRIPMKAALFPKHCTCTGSHRLHYVGSSICVRPRIGQKKIVWPDLATVRRKTAKTHTESVKLANAEFSLLIGASPVSHTSSLTTYLWSGGITLS